MRIVNVTTADEGGGGRAAFRLNSGLLRLGCDATLFVASKFHPSKATVVFRPEKNILGRVRRTARRCLHNYKKWRYRNQMEPSWNIDHRCQRGADPLKQLPAADLINIHTLANFIDYEPFIRKVRVPTVWTLHTMSPFTGGCTNSYGCQRFTESCGCCPLLESESPNDLSRDVFVEKQGIYRHAKSLNLVAPSRWMAAEAERSSLFRQFPVTVIPNGIDTEVYTPHDRGFARKVLGIPPSARVLLFVTQHSVQYRLKGFSVLMEALLQLVGLKDLHLITLGSDALDEVPIRHTHFGHVFDDHLLSLIYSASNLFVLPSLFDNLPNVVIEAFACGIPVVAFDVGGVPDMVRPGVTGELAPRGDAGELGRKIAELLQNDSRREAMSEECRRVAVAEYSMVVQAERYLELYHRIVDEAKEI